MSSALLPTGFPHHLPIEAVAQSLRGQALSARRRQAQQHRMLVLRRGQALRRTRQSWHPRSLLSRRAAGQSPFPARLVRSPPPRHAWLPIRAASPVRSPVRVPPGYESTASATLRADSIPEEKFYTTPVYARHASTSHPEAMPASSPPTCLLYTSP